MKNNILYTEKYKISIDTSKDLFHIINVTDKSGEKKILFINTEFISIESLIEIINNVNERIYLIQGDSFIANLNYDIKNIINIIEGIIDNINKLNKL